MIWCFKNFSAYSRAEISDRRTSFTSKEFEEFTKETNMKHMKIVIASLQANGQIERYNRMLAPALGKLYDGKDWYKTLIEFAI